MFDCCPSCNMNECPSNLWSVEANLGDHCPYYTSEHVLESEFSLTSPGGKDYKAPSRRAFIFYPSYADVYYILREKEPDLALQYLEALIYFGNEQEQMKDINPYVNALLQSPMKTIEKAYTNYIIKTHEGKHIKYLARLYKKDYLYCKYMNALPAESDVKKDDEGDNYEV